MASAAREEVREAERDAQSDDSLQSPCTVAEHAKRLDGLALRALLLKRAMKALSMEEGAFLVTKLLDTGDLKSTMLVRI